MFETFWDDEDGKLEFEYVADKVFAHATAKRWNKSIYLKFQVFVIVKIYTLETLWDF